jgi:hypothetical protein
MNLNVDNLQELTQLAIIAARAAGDIIDRHYQNKIQVHHKDRGTSVASQVVTEVDYKAQAAILEILEPSCVNNGLALLTGISRYGPTPKKNSFLEYRPNGWNPRFYKQHTGFFRLDCAGSSQRYPPDRCGVRSCDR